MKYTTVKLAKRGALLHLNNEPCRVKVKGVIYETEEGLIESQGEQYVISMSSTGPITIPVKDITHIEIPVSRFTPDILTFMEIEWNE